MECKQIYNTGLREYLFDSYNIIDFTVLSLYLASYTLRFFVDRWINTSSKIENISLFRALKAGRAGLLSS